MSVLCRNILTTVQADTVILNKTIDMSAEAMATRTVEAAVPVVEDAPVPTASMADVADLIPGRRTLNIQFDLERDAARSMRYVFNGDPVLDLVSGTPLGKDPKGTWIILPIEWFDFEEVSSLARRPLGCAMPSTSCLPHALTT